MSETIVLNDKNTPTIFKRCYFCGQKKHCFNKHHIYSNGDEHEIDLKIPHEYWFCVNEKCGAYMKIIEGLKIYMYWDGFFVKWVTNFHLTGLNIY